MKKCLKCKRKTHARKLCKIHYQHFIDLFPNRHICNVQKCKNISRAKKLCWTHYKRFRKTGKTSPPIRKGFYFNKDGYKVLILKNRRVFEHRFIMEKKLNRPLKKSEVVHHKNGVKTDNRVYNLSVFKRSDHISLHNKLRQHS